MLEAEEVTDEVEMEYFISRAAHIENVLRVLDDAMFEFASPKDRLAIVDKTLTALGVEPDVFSIWQEINSEVQEQETLQ